MKERSVRPESVDAVMNPKQVRQLRNQLRERSFRPVENVLTLETVEGKADYLKAIEWYENDDGDHITIEKVPGTRKYEVLFDGDLTELVWQGIFQPGSHE